MKTKILILALCALATAAPAQTLVEGKNAAGSTRTQNPVVVGGEDSGGVARVLKLNTDGTLSLSLSPLPAGTNVIGHVIVDNFPGSVVSYVSTFKGAANTANGQVTASTSAATLKAANSTRRSISIVNTDTAITVYVGIATVTTGNGFPLKAGQSISIDSTALIQVIAASGSPVVAYLETYD